MLCPCGCTLRRLSGIYGRNDNMVKVRRVNVFGAAIGSLGVAAIDAYATEERLTEFAGLLKRAQAYLERALRQLMAPRPVDARTSASPAGAPTSDQRHSRRGFGQAT